MKTTEQELFYDYLVVAAGATHAYFGHDDWEPYAPGLKTIEDALEIRRRVLLAFELAERRALSGAGDEPLNFVVVGGGPTGVELAGRLAEIARHVLAHEFRSIDPSRARIVLLEGGPRVLPAYAEDLSRSAEEQLRHLGVEVRTNAMVTLIEPGVVNVGDTWIVAPCAVGCRRRRLAAGQEARVCPATAPDAYSCNPTSAFPATRKFSSSATWLPSRIKTASLFPASRRSDAGGQVRRENHPR